MTYPNKREHLLALVKEGNRTREQLMEETGLSSKSLGTNMTYLRMMGYFPAKKEDGTYGLVSKEEYEAIVESRKSKAPAKVLTPEERIDAAQKREHRAAGALTKAQERHAADPSRENELRLEIAQRELELSSLLLCKAEQAANGPDVAPADDSDVE